MRSLPRSNGAAPSPKVIGLLGFDGVTALDLAGPMQAFAMARFQDEPHRNRPCYTAIIIGLESKTFVSEAGAIFKSQYTLRSAPPLDTIIIPGGSGMRTGEIHTKIAGWLLERANFTRRMASVSTGVYPLARTGLLNGRHVTTHWRFARDVARTFPQLHVSEAASFLKDGSFYSAGGGAAGIEMTLALIQEDFGAKPAAVVARELVTTLRPPGGDEGRLDALDHQQSAEERLAELPAWIITHLRTNLSVEVLATRAGLCPRHFSRLFKRTFNRTPAEFVEELRLAEAERYLTSRRDSIESVAASVGFKSASAFRRAFERRLGVTPRSFRQRTYLGQSVSGDPNQACALAGSIS